MELALDNQLVSNLSDLMSNGYVLLFVLSLLPITELRLSVPFGILVLGLPWKYVFIVCVLANSIIGVLLVFILGWGISVFSRISFMKSFIDRLLVLSRKKYTKYQKYSKIVQSE